MAYKVFFVEDEVVTREGVRDNVNWQANGFEFCGEAPDGEIALPLLQATRPDVLITDIKMPFMDGLQLSKIVRERMPWVKIVILSGHDEFEYAQKAISLGVTDYLLKPVTVQKLHQVLQKLAVQLDQERKEQENLSRLREQFAENRAALREKLLLKLATGVIDATQALDQGQQLGLDLVAKCYLVIILKTEMDDRSEAFDYDEHQRVQQIITCLVDANPDSFFLNKSWEEHILMMKGHTSEYLEEERDLLLEQINREIKKTRYRLTTGIGTTKKRLTDISQSFVEALVCLKNNAGGDRKPVFDCAELLTIDKSAVDGYLRWGAQDDFDQFFDAFVGSSSEKALRSQPLKDYLFMEIILAAARLVNDLGGDIEQVIPELNAIDTQLTGITNFDQLRNQARKIVSRALALRDSKPGSQYAEMIHQAKKFIESQYTDPELSLNAVAAQVHLSSNHFSVIFSQETHQTFKEYLTELRINKAKELLRTTAARTADIAYQVGYNDPHYFSAAFKKKTGLSPTEFRAEAVR